MKNYKTIIFDVGGVLLSYRWQDMLKDYGIKEEDIPRLGREMFEDSEDLWVQLDYALIPVEEIISRYKEKYPLDGEAIAWFIRHGEYMPIARPTIWKLVHRLKEAGYQIYLLSNYSENLFIKHTQYADFMKDIDGLVVSYMIHEIKPHPPIYEALVEKYQLNKEDCLFFDDRLENVNGAIAVGIDARQVLSIEGLENDLKALLS